MLFEIRLLTLLHRGKARGTYAVNDDLMMMIATDRIQRFQSGP